mmetsp:Transcript_8956/g.25697  ORF Transcript_8956/g.25697 Transcript_8956/m.25697 type:complete len:218 (-) Transcript_8956:86-739(-)
MDRVPPRLPAPAHAAIAGLQLAVEAPLLAIHFDGGVEGAESLHQGVAEDVVGNGRRRCQVVDVQEHRVRRRAQGLTLKPKPFCDVARGDERRVGELRLHAVGPGQRIDTAHERQITRRLWREAVVRRDGDVECVAHRELELHRAPDGPEEVPTPQRDPIVLRQRRPICGMQPQPIDGAAVQAARPDHATHLCALSPDLSDLQATPRRGGPWDDQVLA